MFSMYLPVHLFTVVHHMVRPALAQDTFAEYKVTLDTSHSEGMLS